MENLNDYLQQANNVETKYWINHNLKNYLKKQPEIIGEIEHIIDYFNSDKAPKRLRKMSYKEALEGAEKWSKTLQKKAESIVETEEDVQTEIDFDNGFRLVRLIGKNAFQREGNLMRHCVASYADKNCFVYSLRDVENKPHATIEVTKGETIQQIKGKGNGPIHPKYIYYVLQTLEHFGMDVRDSEMRNLGYIKYDSDYEKVIRSCFNKLKFVVFKNKTYYWEKMQPKLKNNYQEVFKGLINEPK